ncbi:hypothetical protein BY458DRAFT_534975 [Sporodiniella umbellata]|nr:hypothetical protein BY458DRAFT_534975 [Sporodiniella umbellata]
MGYFPRLGLLAKYQLLDLYGPLLEAIKRGDMQRYLSHLENHFDYFYRHQTYLLLKERGIVLVWRSLIRKICLIKSAETHSVVSFQDCFTAFRKGDPESDFDLNEIECILVSLVSQGYIRGYLHHQKQILVLSRVNAFPPISQVKLYHEKYNETLMEDHIEKNYPPIPPEINYLLSSVEST